MYVCVFINVYVNKHTYMYFFPLVKEKKIIHFRKVLYVVL